MKKKHPPKIKEDQPNRADFHHSSTSQGGSNFGQGSNDLSKYAEKQGSEKNAGANYEDEHQEWKNEALRFDDLKDTGGEDDGPV